MYFKSIIGAIFTTLAVMSFSANAIPTPSTEYMDLETGTDPLIILATGASPTSQTGQMTGDYLGLSWVLEYTSLLNYTLTNDNGLYSSGTYTNFLITEFLFDCSGCSTGTSKSTGVFTDSTYGNIINVTSVGTWAGLFGQGPIEWRGTGTFKFLNAAPDIEVAVPATMFLFAPALLGLLVLRRKAKKSVA